MVIVSHQVVAASAVTAVLGVLVWVALTRGNRSARGVPTVSSWLPYLGSSLSFSKDPVAFVRQCQEKYGNVFNVKLGGKMITFFVSPKAYSTLMKCKTLSPKPSFREISKKALGFSQSYVDYVQSITPEPEVVDYHKLVQPHLLHSTALSDLLERTLTQQRRAIEKLTTTGPQRLPLFSFVQRCIFESGSRVLLGDTVMDENPDMWQFFIEFDKSFPLFVTGVPDMFLPSATKARSNLVHALDGYKPGEGAAIIQKRNEALRLTFPPEVVAPHDVARQAMAFLWAASANSIPTAFWSLYHLLHDPVAWKAVEAEVREHLEQTNEWTSDQLNKCVLLASTVDEALRLNASIMLMRVATEDTHLSLPDADVFLAKGSRALIFPSLSHVDDNVFPNAKTFQFDRFVKPTAAQAEAFKPFGMGATMCPGRNFAKNQIKMFIALLMLETKRLAIVPGYAEPTPDPGRLGFGIIPPANDDIQIELEI